MIAHVPPPATTASIYRDFLQALSNQRFAGDISARYADRVVLSTDNSIYQRLPQAVVFPLHASDVDHESQNWRHRRPSSNNRRGRLLDTRTAGGKLPATGYSCRSRMKRLRGQRLRHPIEVLPEALTDPAEG